MRGQTGGKVAFVATVYRHLSGFHLPFIALLQRKGYDVHAYGRPDHGKEQLQGEGVVCHDIPFQRQPFSRENWTAYRELTQSFREEGFDMVHVHTPVAAFLGRRAARKAGVPAVVYTAHGFHFHRGAPWKNWLLYYPLEYWLARSTHHLITMNQEDAWRADTMPVRGQAHFVPGVGVDVKSYRVQLPTWVRHRVRSELGIGQEPLVVLCVAELNDNKNQIQLLRAFQQLVAAKGPAYCLFAGTGPNEAGLREAAEGMGMAPYVHFLGQRRDIPDLLAACDAVALVSMREGLPRCLLEGMAAGRALLATDVRGSRDLVIDGETGYLVPVGDVAATAQRLIELAERPELRKEMGERNERRVFFYEIASVVAKMERIYGAALGWGVQTGAQEEGVRL
jgi:glycosyltransferase involved in cell wall biosynthesis